MYLRRTTRHVVDGFGKHRLLVYASAIAYQIISSLVPIALFGLALAGTVGATDVWTRHLRPELKTSASPEVFAVADKTVSQILAHQQVFWVTFGLLVALWELGGAVRATMAALDDIYATRRRRGRRDKYVTSTWLAAAVGALWLAALAVLVAGQSVVGGPLGVLARYLLAALLLAAATGLTVRVAPTEPPPVKWVSIGSIVIVIGWLVVVGGYVFYATSVASYRSVYGSLATIFVLIIACYLSPIVFLTGVLVDAEARERGNAGS